MNVSLRSGVSFVLCLSVLAFAVSCGSGGDTFSSQPARQTQGRQGDAAPSNSGEPRSVEDIPEQFRLTLEEVARIKQFYKVKPDITVDPSKSERIDCVNCAVIVNGIILYPPFYLTKTKYKIFINGYQF